MALEMFAHQAARVGARCTRSMSARPMQSERRRAALLGSTACVGLMAWGAWGTYTYEHTPPRERSALAERARLVAQIMVSVVQSLNTAQHGTAAARLARTLADMAQDEATCVRMAIAGAPRLLSMLSDVDDRSTQEHVARCFRQVCGCCMHACIHAYARASASYSSSIPSRQGSPPGPCRRCCGWWRRGQICHRRAGTC